MQIAHLRNILAQYGVERIFLTPNKKKGIFKGKQQTYKDGYVEFSSVEQAQNAELVFNGNLIGGKKGSNYFDQFLTLKYRKGLKWQDLIEQKQNKKKMKEARIITEVEQVKKIHNFILGQKFKSQKVMKNLIKEIGKKEALPEEEVAGLQSALEKGKRRETSKVEFNKQVLQKMDLE